MDPAVASQALQLRDIHMPPAPPWWPPAPAWWALATLSIVLLSVVARYLWRAWRDWRRVRVLLTALDEIEHGLVAEPRPQRLATLAVLMKRVALARHPRSEVAALSGAAWLAFLDRTGGDGGFATGPGRVLADGVYHATLDDDLDVPALMELVRRWVRHNSGWRA
ncbi:MAG: DUF4381 domain-containing protein [Gammaproteobacteria bacterium]|nr:DUF4381 domain-containing protein [Gammaproteobacteria bacterium]MCP5298879.1 DUF4381 domain-containing protein [Chromatiaceae bacterium]